ncbi:DMT family transporter [Roseomonas genomospecies 6]|nr:DMT family transporter [Roseomonas genomospecies 6]
MPNPALIADDPTAKGPPVPSSPGMAGKPLEGALWMLCAALFMAIGNAMIRHVGGELHPFQIVFFRNLFGLMFMLPWIAAVGPGRLRTGRAGLYASRSLTSLLAMLGWFYSVTHMPLPDATALSFTIPLFVTAGAALFLGETVRARRWAAVLVGLAGVVIVVRPGAAALDPTLLVMLLHCAAAAATTLQVRALASSDGVMVVVAYMGLFLTPMALVPALFVWEWPTWTALGWLVLLGGMMTLSQLALTRAFKLAPASAMMPYDYARLPFTALLAWPLFGEAMDVWGWAGAGVIAASALYTAHRDAAQSRSERAAAKP